MPIANETGPSFASIGHQESWEKVAAILNAFRKDNMRNLSVEEVREIAPWIPPRPVVRIRIRSHPRDIVARGVYIETFVALDNAKPGGLRTNIERVLAAADSAINENVRIATLGGFTSIVLEGNMDLLTRGTSVAFTTGNTLTAAYVVKGVERACALHDLVLSESSVLVVGSTGDIGTACVSYFSNKAGSLLLCARNEVRLRKQVDALHSRGVSAWASTDLNGLVRQADAIILVASTGTSRLCLTDLRPHTVICDAGYPKNAADVLDDEHASRVFHGGMGLVLGGYDFTPDFRDVFYDFPVPSIGHGCMLEGALLALEGRYESYSTGRGRICLDAIEELWEISQAHGFVLAPFYNSRGLWSEQGAHATDRRPT